jgi:putative membrane protein
MMWWSVGSGWVGWLLMTVLMVGFWAVVVFAIWALFRGDATSPAGPKTAEQILNERYARGEIDGMEYQIRRAALAGQG